MSKIEEIEKLKQLLDSGSLSRAQYEVLLKNIVGQDDKAIPTPAEQTVASTNLPPPIPASVPKQVNMADILSKYHAIVPKRVKVLNGLDLGLGQSIIADWALNTNSQVVDGRGKLDAEDLLLYYDDSLWGNSKSGLIITSNGIIYKCYGEKELFYWPLVDIQKVHKVEVSGSKMLVWIDSISAGESIGICEVYGDEEVCQYLEGLLLSLN